MPVAVELNGLLPGLGPGRGAPGRGPAADGRGADGRGAPDPDPWVLGADGRAPWPPWPGWSERAGRCPPGPPGRGAEGRAWPEPGLRKSAGVAGVLGGPGTLGAPGAPGVPCGLGSGPGRDAGDGGTGGSLRAAVSGDAPLAAAPSGAAARAAEPLATPSGAILGAGGTAAATPSRAGWPTPGPGRGLTPAGPAPPGAAGIAPSRGADDAAGLDLAADCSGCSGALEANASLSRRTTGASIVEDADLTNSPISLSWSMTALLSTPNSFASS